MALWRGSKARGNDHLWFLSGMTCLPYPAKSTNAHQYPYKVSSNREHGQTACWTGGALFKLLLGLHLFLQPISEPYLEKQVSDYFFETKTLASSVEGRSIN